MFGSIGMPELIIGLVVILLLFGAKRVPELARGLGSGVREFKKGTTEGEVEDKKKEDEDGCFTRRLRSVIVKSSKQALSTPDIPERNAVR